MRPSSENPRAVGHNLHPPWSVLSNFSEQFCTTYSSVASNRCRDRAQPVSRVDYRPFAIIAGWPLIKGARDFTRGAHKNVPGGLYPGTIVPGTHAVGRVARVDCPRPISALWWRCSILSVILSSPGTVRSRDRRFRISLTRCVLL